MLVTHTLSDSVYGMDWYFWLGILTEASVSAMVRQGDFVKSTVEQTT